MRGQRAIVAIGLLGPAANVAAKFLVGYWAINEVVGVQGRGVATLALLGGSLGGVVANWAIFSIAYYLFCRAVGLGLSLPMSLVAIGHANLVSAANTLAYLAPVLNQYLISAISTGDPGTVIPLVNGAFTVASSAYLIILMNKALGARLKPTLLPSIAIPLAQYLISLATVGLGPMRP